MSRPRSIRQAAKAKRSILPTVEDYSCVHERDLPEREAWELAPEWWRTLGGDPQSADDAWRDALADAQSGSEPLNRRT